jgi:anti-sigma factor RsiW
VTCRELADFIMDYLNGELPGEVRVAFEEHLTRCPACVSYLAAYQSAVELGRQAFDDPEAFRDLPEDLVKAILAAREP